MAKLLVIEDEQPILEEVLDWLQFEGYESFGETNGLKGLKAAQDWQPDLIVCDITMPEMDGYSVLLELRKHPATAKIPFMFLTARADKPFMRHGMELGADDYLTKPFTRAELLSAIRGRLQRHQLINESHHQDFETFKLKLVRMVTHQLKTPLMSLTFVRDIIERQFDQLDQDQIRDLLETLRGGTDRLEHLVQQTVYIAQIEGGILTSEFVQQTSVPIHLWHLIPAMIDLARRIAYRNNDAQIIVDQRDANASFTGDMAMLKHAMAELVSNAISFSPDQKPVTISQWVSGGYVWISIFDHGMGMSKQETSQAQQAFEQIRRERLEQQGLGLGLTIARQLVELNNGLFEIGSTSGKGTQVTIGFRTAK
jgi:signal transduction histidine kinase